MSRDYLMNAPVKSSRPAPLLRWTFALALFALLAVAVKAQTGPAPGPTAIPAKVSGPSIVPSAATNAVRAEEIRAACVQARRCVCGRVLKVFPNGVLVESGYPTLLREDLHGAWHLPHTVVAHPAAHLVERNEPDAICVGTVFLTDLPKPRGAKKEHIEPYDYVVLHSYPAGYCSYSSVGSIKHLVRRFSGGLETAVRLTQFSNYSTINDP